MKKVGASGSMTLLVERDAEEERELRNIRLEPSSDGKTVHLVDVDTRKPGVHREVRYEITPAELIAVIRAQGQELPGDAHVLRAVSAD
jgi:hypothetical protein